MNLRFEKPIFQYIQKKCTPHSSLLSDFTLNSKLKEQEKPEEVKKLDVPHAEYESIDDKENMTEPIIERKSTKFFNTKDRVRRQTVDTLRLYDRIAKEQITVHITYVDTLKNEEDIKNIEMALRKKAEVSAEQERKNCMKQKLKEEKQKEKKRVSMSTKIKLGSLVFNHVGNPHQMYV